MRILKSLLLAVALVMGTASASAHAEKGQNAAGISFNYAAGTNNMSNLGLGLHYSYQLSDNFRIEPSFTYYFDTEKFSMKDINVNAHYLFNMKDDRSHFYPLFGFTSIFGAEREYGEKNTDSYHAKDTFVRFGVNLGAGYQYDVTDDFAIIAEAKYRLVETYGSLGLKVGCVITF